MRYFYLGIDVDNDKAACLSDHPRSVEKAAYRFDDGEPLADWFPRQAVYPMDPDYPNARELHDLQENTLSVLIVSRPLRETMQSVGCKNVEFLPIIIKNHRGKVASDEYSIANVLSLVDCLDLKKSRYRRDALLPERIDRFDRVVLVASRIPAGLHIFRLKERPHSHFVSEEMRRAIESKRLRGMVFVPVDEYTTIGTRP